MYHEAQYRKLIKLSGSNLPDSAMLKHVMTSTNRCINRQCTVRFSCELYQLGYIVNSDEKRNYQVNLCKSNAPSKRNLVAIYTVNQNTKIFTLMQYMNAVVTSIRGEFHGANVATKWYEDCKNSDWIERLWSRSGIYGELPCILAELSHKL